MVSLWSNRRPFHPWTTDHAAPEPRLAPVALLSLYLSSVFRLKCGYSYPARPDLTHTHLYMWLRAAPPGCSHHQGGVSDPGLIHLLLQSTGCNFTAALFFFHVTGYAAAFSAEQVEVTRAATCIKVGANVFKAPESRLTGGRGVPGGVCVRGCQEE